MKITHQKLAKLLVVFVATVGLNSKLHAQNNFRISVESNENGYTLTCQEGCDWKKLEWKSTPNSVQMVNQSGISDQKPTGKIAKELTTGFAFTVSKTDKGFEFGGLSNTAWTELKSSCKTGSSIDRKSVV